MSQNKIGQIAHFNFYLLNECFLSLEHLKSLAKSENQLILDDFKLLTDDPLNQIGDNSSFPLFFRVEFLHNDRPVVLNFAKTHFVDKQPSGDWYKSESIYVFESNETEPVDYKIQGFIVNRNS